MKTTLSTFKFGSKASFAVLLSSLIFSSSMAYAEVSANLDKSAHTLRVSQAAQIKAEKLVQTIKEAIHSKHEVISKRESLIRKLRADQKSEDKIASRDRGAGEEARQAREVTKKDRDFRIAEIEKALEGDRSSLASLEKNLDNAKGLLGLVKSTRQSARASLKKVAQDERAAQNCEKASLLSKMGSGIGAMFDSAANIARSRAARDEHEVQHLVRLAYCDPAHAVSERRLPKEKETDIFVPKETQDSNIESFAQSAL